MLKTLHIKNFAIIETLTVHFAQGLNIITGETGAGKSIMLDALGLALGQRADTSSVGNPSEKCIVEAEFEISSLKLQPFFEDNGYDYDASTILRREIAPNGRSRAFINDTPCRLSDLHTLSESLVEVHQQFDQLSIREEDFQRTVLDVVGQQLEQVKLFSKAYAAWKKGHNKLKSLKEKQREALKEKDYLEFQFQELDELDIENDEERMLSDQQTLLSQAEEITLGLNQGRMLLSEEEVNILDMLHNISSAIAAYKDLEAINGIDQRLESLISEVEDLSREFENVVDNIEVDPTRLKEIDERLSTIFHLKKKHQVQDANDLIEIKDSIEEKLRSIVSEESEIIELENSLTKEASRLKQQATELSKQRKKVVKDLEKNVEVRLKELGMPDARFEVNIETQPLHAFGIDHIEFKFSSNKGIPPSPIKLSASGGEISRLNLTIKSLVAGQLSLPTMIFDEIDSGVSGEIARRIGHLLASLGEQHQIVCITHTPQIASLGQHHLHVQKDNSRAKTTTSIKKLTQEDRIIEIGQMLGGDPPGKAALDAAKDLLSSV